MHIRKFDLGDASSGQMFCFVLLVYKSLAFAYIFYYQICFILRIFNISLNRFHSEIHSVRFCEVSLTEGSVRLIIVLMYGYVYDTFKIL